MNQRAQLFFWVIFLLVGLNLVTPDPVELTPTPSLGSPVALIDSDDDLDDPDRSHDFNLIAHAEMPLLDLGIFLAGLALLGRLQPPIQAHTPQLPSLSPRIPRSPPAN